MLSFGYPFSLLCVFAFQSFPSFKDLRLREYTNVKSVDHDSTQRESGEESRYPAIIRRLADEFEVLAISRETTVAEGAVLTLHKVRATPGSGFTTTAFNVEGKLILTESVVENFDSAMFSVTGEVVVTNSTFRNNSGAVFFLLSAAKVRIVEVIVDSHRGTFLLFRGSGHPLISIEDSTLIKGVPRGTEALILISIDEGAGNVSISRSVFSRNEIRLLLFDVHSTAVTVRDCSFSSNSEPLVTLYQSEGSTEVQSCRFLDNRNTILNVLALRGVISVLDVVVFNQSSAVFFSVAHNGMSEECAAQFRNVQIEKSASYFNVSFSSVLSVSACTIYAQGFTLESTMLQARLDSRSVGLFVLQQAIVHFADCSTINSGTSGVLVNAVHSFITLTNCSFTNSTILQSVYFFMILGEMTFDGIAIADLRKVIFANDYLLAAVYFALMQSKLNATNLVIRQAEMFWSSAIVAPQFSVFSVKNVELINVRAVVGIIPLSSSGDVFSFTATGCTFYFYVYQTVSSSDLTITGTEITNATFPRPVGSILSLCTKSHVSLVSLTMTGTTVSNFAKAKNSYLEVHDIFASACTFQYFLRNVINSQLFISGLRFVNSIGGLVNAYKCNVTVTDSMIESVSTSSFWIQASATTVELRNVTMTNVTVGIAVAHLQEESAITMHTLIVRSLISLQDEGLIINGGNLTIRNSVFSDFVGSLIQATDASISLISVNFANGYNFIESQISRVAYGGVLGCIECESIWIDNITAQNVSSMYGGAISIQSSMNGEEKMFVVKRSVFESCRAVIGGALYIRNVNFDIDGCTFQHNSAVESGGAIDFSVSGHYTKSLRNIIFTNNSANEGGAVKWHKAQVLLQNVTVENNYALYGPDFASYGIELSSRLSTFSNLSASGYPLHLVYELLDHYGQRVTASHDKVLILQNTEGISFPGYTTVVRNRGLFNFTVPMVLAPPGSTQILQAYINVEEAGDIADRRSISFRKCVPGEVSLIDRCVYCFSGTVSFRPESGECFQCPKHAFCFGGTNMTADPHYWRSSNDSLVLVECPVPGTCLGGNNNSCAFGYTGKLCNECIDGYYRYQMTSCEECDKAAALYAQIVPVAAVLALFVLLVAKCSESETRLFTLKTALSHAQMLSALTPLKANLPRSFRGFLHGLSYFSSLLITDLPLSCVGVKNESLVRATVASCLLPFFSICTAVLFVIYQKRQVVVCYSSFLLFVPTITIQSLHPLFACVRGGDGRRWLFTDMSQECWSADHQRLLYALFIPSVTISIIIPTLLIIGVSFNRFNRFAEYFPMWTCGYRWALWEVVQSVFKHSLQALMYSGLGFSRVGQFSSGLIVLYVLCFTNVFFVTKVYRGKESFWLTECSYLIVTMSYSMCGVYVFKETGYSGSDVTFSISFLILNSGFLLCCASMLLFDFKETHFPIVQIEVEKLTSNTRSYLPDVSIGEVIVPNNSLFLVPLQRSPNEISIHEDSKSGIVREDRFG